VQDVVFFRETFHLWIYISYFRYLTSWHCTVGGVRHLFHVFIFSSMMVCLFIGCLCGLWLMPRNSLVFFLWVTIMANINAVENISSYLIEHLTWCLKKWFYLISFFLLLSFNLVGYQPEWVILINQLLIYFSMTHLSLILFSCLIRKILGVDLVAKEGHYHNSCRKAYS
jgi:hypothetical protein